MCQSPGLSCALGDGEESVGGHELLLANTRKPTVLLVAAGTHLEHPPGPRGCIKGSLHINSRIPYRDRVKEALSVSTLERWGN